jgi:hypothetical protein
MLAFLFSSLAFSALSVAVPFLSNPYSAANNGNYTLIPLPYALNVGEIKETFLLSRWLILTFSGIRALYLNRNYDTTLREALCDLRFKP